MRQLRPTRYALLVGVVLILMTGAAAWLWRTVSRIEVGLPLAMLQKERDSSAFHLDLARLEGALQLAAAAPDAAHVQQAAFALDLNLTRLANNQARHDTSDKDIVAMQQRLNGTLRQLARVLAEPNVDTQRLQLGLTELSRMHPEHQRLNDSIFQNSMDRVSQLHRDLARLRNAMVLLIGLLGLVGVLLFVLLLRKQAAIALLERQGEELRRQKEQLLIREREFRMLAENSPDAIVRYDREGRRTYINSAVIRASGVPASQLIGKSFAEQVPLLMSAATAAIYEARIREVLATGKAAEWEMDWLTHEGNSVSFQVHAVPEFNADGELESVLAVSRDITERRRADELQRLAASVFTTSQEGIVITDAKNCIINVNEAFTRITGYSPAEVQGQNPKLLQSGRQNEGYYEEMWRVLNVTDRWRGEIWNRRKSGEIYPELLSIVAVRDQQGLLLNYVGIFSDISQLKEHEAELDRIAHFDPLTGLPNRRLFSDRLIQATAQTRRNGLPLAVCFLDLDGFKPINDQFGHEVGDQMLVIVAKHLCNALRGGDTVARIGGDEFVLLLTHLTEDQECAAILDRVLASVATPETIAGNPVSVSASIGVTLFPHDNSDADSLIRHADMAMYQAKRTGKNSYYFYDRDSVD